MQEFDFLNPADFLAKLIRRRLTDCGNRIQKPQETAANLAYYGAPVWSLSMW
jgi:hypothetical protein